jgi:hypothetical protein
MPATAVLHVQVTEGRERELRVDLDSLQGRHVELKRKFRSLYLAYRQVGLGACVAAGCSQLPRSLTSFGFVVGSGRATWHASLSCEVHHYTSFPCWLFLPCCACKQGICRFVTVTIAEQRPATPVCPLPQIRYLIEDSWPTGTSTPPLQVPTEEEVLGAAVEGIVK